MLKKKLNTKFIIYFIFIIILLFSLYYYLNKHNIHENFEPIITVPLKQSTKIAFVIQVIQGSGTITIESLSFNPNKESITFTKLQNINVQPNQKYTSNVLTSGNIGYSISTNNFITYNIYTTYSNCLQKNNNNYDVCNNKIKIIKATEFSSLPDVYKNVNNSIIYKPKEYFKFYNLTFNPIYKNGIIVQSLSNAKTCLRIRDGSLHDYYNQEEEEQSPFTYTVYS